MTEERLADLERRVALLEFRATVLRISSNRRVLEVLRDFEASPFNDGTLTLTPDSIRNATGLDDRDLAMALNALAHVGYVEVTHVDSTGHWRITDDGRWAISG